MTTDSTLTQGLQVGDKNTQINYFGVTDTELAEQLVVAKAALRNFFKIFDQQHLSVEDWDHALRQFAERYKDLQQRAVQLASDDPEVLALQEQAKDAIDKAELETAERLLSYGHLY